MVHPSPEPMDQAIDSCLEQILVSENKKSLFFFWEFVCVSKKIILFIYKIKRNLHIYESRSIGFWIKEILP